MNRRDFFTTSIGAGAAFGMLGMPKTALGGTDAPLASPPAFPQVKGLTKYVAEFVVGTKYADVPAGVIELGKKSILDELGLAIAGAKSKGSDMLRTYVKSLGVPPGGATVIGTSEKLPLRFAALVNGLGMHIDDFDDTQLAVAKDRVYGLMTHPTSPVLSAVLGLVENELMSGRDLMLAYHIGVEIECKLTEACSPRSYSDGFQATSVFGVFGTAAVCAKIRRYDAERIMRAMAIAATRAGGLRENFGTLSKPLAVGQAAEAGIVACDLAALGWDGAVTILEANNGFFHAYGGTYDPAAILNKLGQPWTFAMPGISIKPHPSGSLTHPGMTEMLRLIRTENIRPSDVESVDVGTNGKSLSTLIHHHPKTGLQAKFSMEYSMAILLVKGRAGLSEYTDAAVNEPEVQQMIARIHPYADPEAETAGFDKMTTIIKIHLKDGRTVSGRADFGKGSPADPMSFDEVADKFRGCAAFAGWPAEKTSSIIGSVRHLEDLADARSLIELCRA